MQWLITGLALGVASVFAVAAITKVGRVWNLETALVQLLPGSVWEVRGLDSRILGRAVVVGELVLAAAVIAGLFANFASPSLVACAAVLGVFTLVRERARQLGAPCSCSGLTKSPTTRADVLRIAALAGVAIFAALNDPTVSEAAASEWSGSVLVALATLTLVFLPETRVLALRMDKVARMASGLPAATQPMTSRRLSRRQFVGATSMTLLGTGLSLGLEIPSAAAGLSPYCLLLVSECEECCVGASDPAYCDACCAGCDFCCEFNLPPHCDPGQCENCWDRYATTH